MPTFVHLKSVTWQQQRSGDGPRCLTGEALLLHVSLAIECMDLCNAWLAEKKVIEILA